MKFLLFEWMVGGGLIESAQPLDFDAPFFQQGSAMFAALAEDLNAHGHDVVAPLDPRALASDILKPWREKRKLFSRSLIAKDLPRQLHTLAKTVDQIIFIAPESDGILAECHRWVEDFQNKWFSGSLAFIERASNKNSMQDFLAARGIPVPPHQIRAGQRWVAKPADGAGSENVHVFSSQERLNEFQNHDAWRTEAFVQGKSVSVAIVGFQNNRCYLPPTGQIFADTSKDSKTGHYIGTEFPLCDESAARAQQLAIQTASVLREFSGFIGIDMILSDQEPDVVIEINPRMTMSYCNLPIDQRRRWLSFFNDE